MSKIVSFNKGQFLRLQSQVQSLKLATANNSLPSSLNTTISTKKDLDFTFPEQKKTLTNLSNYSRKNHAKLSWLEKNNNPNSAMHEQEHSKWFSMYQDQFKK